MTQFEDRGLSVDEACVMIGISRSQMWKLINEKGIRVVRIGKRAVVPVSAINDFLAGPGVKQLPKWEKKS